MKKFVMVVLGAVAFALGAPGAQQALQLTFFGEDVGPGDAVISSNGPLLSHSQADAAQAAFLALLSGVRPEDFDGFPAGTLAPLSVSFAQPSGTVTATLSGLLSAVRAENSVDVSVGQFPISRSNYWSSQYLPAALSPFAFSLEFSAPQVAFGFFGVDIGDAGAQVSLELGLLGAGTLPPMGIPHTLGTETTTGGSVLYFGLINTDNPFTRVTFISPTASDAFAFDNFTIASANQVVPGPKVIPEPDTLVLLGSGLTIGACILRRWRRACACSAPGCSCEPVAQVTSVDEGRTMPS
jgi:hypothetical protein